MVLCWAAISGYAAACWRALAARGEVELRVIAFEAGPAMFDNDIVRGIECRLLNEKEQQDEQLIRSLVLDWRPDVLYTSGWFHPPYKRLMSEPELRAVPKWIGVDTPWIGTFRQQAARVALRGYVGRMDRVIVAGERAWQYMRRVGVPESRLTRGVYGFDHTALLPLYEQRKSRPGGWPRRFLFVGRYAPEKGIDTLLEAYARYRRDVSDPWPLTMCGGGPLRHLVTAGGPGVEDRGFVQPRDLPPVWGEHGVFILPSRYEPWGVVIAEAAGAGLPVICTEACGASVEIVRSMFNGMTVATGDAGALARAMQWAHVHHGELAEMGGQGQALAAAFSAEAWATRWAEAAREDLKRGRHLAGD